MAASTWQASKIRPLSRLAWAGAAQGLGKTLQTISFLAYMQSERGIGGPSLGAFCTPAPKDVRRALPLLRCHALYHGW